VTPEICRRRAASTDVGADLLQRVFAALRRQIDDFLMQWREIPRQLHLEARRIVEERRRPRDDGLLERDDAQIGMIGRATSPRVRGE
jgi:hypothetical protein